MNQVGMPSIFPYNDSNVDGFISKCKKAIKLAPDGDLNINRAGEYRLRTTDKNGHIVRKYISVDDKQFKSYVIKYCAKHIVSAAKCKGDKLQNIDKEMERLEERFGKHTPSFCKSHKTLIKEWLDDPYIPNPYHPENERTYSTGDGKTYRSKMEYMISKELDEMGIPYKTELPLRIGNRTVYPDFTIAHPKTGCIYYMEACGMMQDENYVKKLLIKINDYAFEGITVGHRLILIFEGKDVTFNPTNFRKTIKNVLNL